MSGSKLRDLDPNAKAPKFVWRVKPRRRVSFEGHVGIFEGPFEFIATEDRIFSLGERAEMVEKLRPVADRRAQPATPQEEPKACVVTPDAVGMAEAKGAGPKGSTRAVSSNPAAALQKGGKGKPS